MKRTNAKHNKWEDHYSRRAKKEHFPARSVYKLEEIQRKYKLIKKGDKILDLGCFPGSWLLYAANLTGYKGHVVGVDIKPVTITVPPHVKICAADLFKVDDEWFKSIGKDFNIVLSDMAPATTGNKNVDATKSFNLCEAALSVAQHVLIPGGTFVCKIFQGEDFKEFLDQVRIHFNKYKIFKPQSSRKASREIYILGLGKK